MACHGHYAWRTCGCGRGARDFSDTLYLADRSAIRDFPSLDLFLGVMF